MKLTPPTKKRSYILFYKPYGVLSQFTGASGLKTLAAFGPFPPGVYPVGRLDADSEGLLLLSDDGQGKHRLLDPRYGHHRTYLVQVEGIPEERTLALLRSGIIIEGKKTRPALVSRLSEEPSLPPRPIPIRIRKNKPTSWLEVTLSEGRNRQVRKMTAAVGHPTLRLVRVKLGELSLSDLQPGEFRPLRESEASSLLGSLTPRRSPNVTATSKSRKRYHR